MRLFLACSTQLVAIIALASCDISRNPTPPSPLALGGVGDASVMLSIASRAIPWRCVAAPAGFRPGECPANAFHALSTSAAASSPGVPTNLAGTVSGMRVSLTWTAPGGDDSASSYVVEAGSVSGLADLANFDTGNSAPLLTVDGVPSGTYFVRIRAKNVAGTGLPSNEIQLTVGSGPAPCTSTPGSPTGFTASTSGSSVTLTWTAPSGGCTPTGYQIEAGSATGLSNLANFDTGSTALSFSATGVASGMYYVRVRAVNAAGQSAPSSEATLTIGSTTPTPTPTPTGPTCGGASVPSLVSCINNQPPQAPTARCRDGAYSCSQNRSGTCSTHGGVSCYVCPGPLC